MKVNNSSLSSLASTEATRPQSVTVSNPSAVSAAVPLDDTHLSELVRSLRSLVADPERQARIEYIARSYASGTYHVDAQATASKIIDDAFRRNPT
ncbi:MAG TPA: flagellar biosynthesis anti-sigma factor FlgM [Bryobacteraceae bacterium]|jgi:anti-sigma28 factor (negative regulator of flagellin synthesis)